MSDPSTAQALTNRKLAATDEASSVFRTYLFGQFFSLSGDGLRALAMPLLVFAMTRSAVLTSLAYGCEFVPLAVVSLVGGSLSDRIDRRRAMIYADAIRFTTVISLFMLAAAHRLTIAVLYAGIVVLSSAAAIFMACQASSLPVLARRIDVERIQGALSAAESLSQLALPSVGAALLRLLGVAPAFAINALTYLVSQYSLTRIPSLGPDTIRFLPTASEIWSDIKVGFEAVTADSSLKQQLLITVGMNICGIGGYTVLLPFLKGTLHASDYQVSAAWLLAGIGSLVGALLASRIRVRSCFGRAIACTYFIDGLSFLGVSLSRNIWEAALFGAITAACVQFEVVQIVAFRLRVIPLARLGRAMGVIRFLSLSGIPLGGVAFACLADAFGPRLGVISSSLSCITLATAALLSPAISRDNR